MFEIINETQEKISELKTIEKFIQFVIEKENLENCLFNIILVDNDYIHKLNKEYRNIDKETDVISFALEDNSDEVKLEFRVLGDIYISVFKAKTQSVEYGHSFLRELAFLTVHGLLHLLGYDHMDKEAEKIMFQKQEQLLNEFGITRWCKWKVALLV